ncbi:type II secretion system F family protein [Thiohalomonas denitrificans]|uniref:Type II secretion system protein F (GspF) n=1 Tax=Thiohalomonas denitrificans TaxID=415747 RepID=A0A1G5PLH2_9GAMM|nr:type II secretion system F family protein [Thiohalomonas denitrificans]SCZ50357.1 type II secretion system protein F (GspF) [Thiohalomonas denitrificans]
MAEAAKQDTFIWEGTDRSGKRVSGESAGRNVTLVKANLRRQGVNPSKVRKKPKPLFGGQSKKKITPKDIALFSRQLATMMSSGVPLVQSFEIIGRGHENPSMRELVGAIKADVEGGNNLAAALQKHPDQFDRLTCNLVHAGEQAGILEDLLDKISTYKEKTEAIKSKVKKALFYPTAVLAVAFIITAILLIFVIPVFEDVFSSFGGELPALTLAVIGLSEVFQKWWWAIFGATGLLIYAFVQAKKKSRAVQEAMDKISLKIPVIGDILNKAAIARYARTLSTMFAAGVPLVEALESVAGAVGNVVYGNAVLAMRNEVSTGTSLTDAMTHTNVFPNMVVQMTSIGEEAGSVDQMLGKVADFYEQEVDDAVDSLSSLLEPLIMAILGVLIGTLVIAMYLPIFKMGEVV